MWDLAGLGIKHVSPALAADSQPLHHQGSPQPNILAVFLPILWEHEAGGSYLLGIVHEVTRIHDTFGAHERSLISDIK